MKTFKSLLFLMVIGLLFGSVTACRRSGTAAAKPEGTATEVAATTSETILNDGNDPTVTVEVPDTEGYDLPFREEIRRKYVLKPQSTFRVYAINGPVRVETVEGDTAELVVRWTVAVALADQV